MSILYDERYMRRALELARNAYTDNEVPVGAVIVIGNVIVGDRNRTIELSDSTAHAEILAIREACRLMKNERLTDAVLYTTLEPCPMCMGAIINARISRVVFGAFDKNAGAAYSRMNVTDFPFSANIDVIGGVLEKECAAIMMEFFRRIRNES
jgi:tRNA(adenine34) deaminase